MIKKKQIPTWYKLFIERRLKKLEIALSFLNIAEEYLYNGYVNMAIKYRDKAIKQAK